MKNKNEMNFPKVLDGNETEVYYIYAVLGRLRSMVPKVINRLSVNQSMFPKRFVYKLINDRLNEADKLAATMATALFRRLGSSEFERRGKLVDSAEQGATVTEPSSTCPELDEYFHCVLCNIHDFLINLDWHDAILEESPTKSDDRYINSNLPFLKKFILFRKLLVGKNALKMAAAKSSKIVAKSEIISTLDQANSRIIRSSLSTRRSSPESPGPRRRVRFNKSQVSKVEDLSQDDPRLKRYFSDSHSILALDLTLFAMHLFVLELKRQLSEWLSVSTISMKESMQLIRTSTRKLRVNRFILMVKDREISNVLHASILNNLHEIESTYLLGHLLATVCAQDEERLMGLYKQPHIRIFVNEFNREDEKEILNMVSTQILEILFELTICEINMPPIELTSDKRSKSKTSGASTITQENYLNFITSWLNIDKILLGSKMQPQTAIKQSAAAAKQVKGRIAGNEFDFKSSSRILNQMDNLHELMKHNLTNLVDQIHSKRHVEYCLRLLYAGAGQCLELITRQLELQLDSTKKVSVARQKRAVRQASIGSVDGVQSGNVDMIAIRIRYLKLIHISSSMDSLIREIAESNAISMTNADSTTGRNTLSRLIDDLTKQMESI